MVVDTWKLPHAIEHICETFKISLLYPEQETSLKALLEGKNVFASLPTGYGKSLIFFAALVVFDKILECPCRRSPLCNKLSLVLLCHSTVTRKHVFIAQLLVLSPQAVIITGIDGKAAGWRYYKTICFAGCSCENCP